MSTVAIIVSAIISLPLIYILYLQLHNIKKQTKNLDIEIKNRVRPWIKIEPMTPTHVQTKDQTKAWEDWASTDNLIKVWFNTVLENIGSLPSKDIIIKTSSDFSPINKNNFHEFLGDDIKTTLLPGEDCPLSVFLTAEEFEKSSEIPFYYGVHVQYSYDDKKYAFVGKVFKFYQNDVELLEYWHDNPPNIKYD